MPRKLPGVLILLASVCFATACSDEQSQFLGPVDHLSPDDAGNAQDKPRDAAPDDVPVAAKDASTGDSLASDPYDTAVMCTSKKMWTGGNRESLLMHPGDACITCHSRGEGPKFALAGTLYPTAHEPTDCNGTNASGATVIVTDADGTEHALTPNAAGNFYLSGSVKKPYAAKLVYQGRTRAMAAKQSDGDCNGCHSESGDRGAPGRITLP